MAYTFLSPAKVNLFLYVTGKRKDGYHNLVSLFHTINLYDIFEIQDAKNFSIEIFGKDYKNIPTNEENLIYKVKNLFENYTKRKVNFKVKVYKNIPPFKGLGGGSSNAAIFLKFLNSYFDFPLNEKEIENILLKVGSDTLFFYKASCAIITGRGENIKPLNPINANLYLYLPDIQVSTKLAYKAFRNYDSFTQEKALSIYQTLKKNFPKVHDKSIFFNSFEKLDIEPINKLKKITNNFKNFTLSGSGSAFFSVEEKEIDKNISSIKVSLSTYTFKYF